MPLLRSPAFVAAIGDIQGNRVWAIVLGGILAVVAISLLIASWTRWGQTKSLTKCIAIAFLAHVWLLMYAYGTRMVTPGFGGGTGGGVRTESMATSMPMMLIEEPTPADEAPNDSESETGDEGSDPTEQPAEQPAVQPWEAPLGKVTEVAKQMDAPNSTGDMSMKLPQIPGAPRMLPVERELPQQELPESLSVEQISQMANLTATSTQSPSIKPQTPLPLESTTAVNSRVPPVASSQKRRVDQQPVPTNYQMRLSPQRQQFAFQNGGDVNTESAVERGLAWLARAQSADGGWNAAAYGAGREPPVGNPRPDGENRHNAGLKANTAMTGLALLTFLGAGHTHVEGQYHENVLRGLRYLMQQQFLDSGDLSGRDQIGYEPTVRFARMYSHGMAALAIAEAYGMTGDPALLASVQLACKYSLGKMNPQSGGWRYEFKTDDPGDLSQFGWQAMLLQSASTNQAFALPPPSRVQMEQFLNSVSTGKYGGLCVYRSGFGMRPPAEQATPAMTAEGLASRLLLRFPLSAPAAEEGQRLLLRNLPGRSEENLYYWYYATLAMYQMRGPSMDQAWEEWNDALKQQLCSTQVPRGPNEGSWNPSCVWGSYGGRVYSTAVACMCLEVYYRYLPMYQPDQFANQWQPARR